MTSTLPTDLPADSEPAVRVTIGRTFVAMLSREVRVLRKNFVATFVRVLLQPLLFVFVFAYVLPKVGGGAMSGGAGGGGGTTFSTVLVPGLVGSSIFMQGIMAIVFPLMMELNWQRSITDRALAPLPIPLLAIEKIAAGGLQALIAGLLVFPCVLFVHAGGQGPDVHVSNWPLLIFVCVFGSLLSASAGLLLGTVIDPQRAQMLFGIILMPLSMLGCVYYPWAALEHVRWLQIVSLANPMVFLNEGLRAALTPNVEHMHFWVYGTVILVGTVLLTWLAARKFTQRVLT
ncbi:ABC-2 type transporter [Actinomadura rubteroloni]|uniref:Transport permease protein n=1 Tax=Actinomadura rubteroloni TaxID=1926885 RepID=A0A2P4UDX0_9ACTN|nr:ABC transporter permease [Actinomadura rubteroloni]POM23253.1 ABC-2 type transporter [Actinomadura rubteroloni]